MIVVIAISFQKIHHHMVSRPTKDSISPIAFQVAHPANTVMHTKMTVCNESFNFIQPYALFDEISFSNNIT